MPAICFNGYCIVMESKVKYDMKSLAFGQNEEGVGWTEVEEETRDPMENRLTYSEGTDGMESQTN